MSDEPAINTAAGDDALKVMKELDQQLSIYDKMYMDIYRAQIHLFEHLIETMYADKGSAGSNMLGTPQGKTAFGWWSHLYANGAIYNLDAHKRFLQWYSQTRLNWLRNMDEQIHIFIEYYNKVSHSAKSADEDTKKTPPKGDTVPRRKIASKRSVTKTAKTVRRTRKTAK